jgi:transglutaminase-like putative cysteine protease
MKSALLVLILLSVSFASSFGYSRITIERTWTIKGAQGEFVDFTGALALNDSNQRVVAVITDPGVTQEVRNDSVIILRFSGTPNSSVFTVKGTAVVDIDYNTSIRSDYKVPGTPLQSTDLTAADDAISSQAGELEQANSSLETIRELVNWVHGNVKYDITYWGLSKSARTVFQERHGVCVEYTHLLIAMARSLGFETRYASGYVYEAGWQPHAWAEINVPGYGWLPADATFGQAGIFDNTHLAVNFGQDQNSTYDLLLTRGSNVTLESSDRLDVNLSSEDPKGVSLSMGIDKTNYTIYVGINNTRDDYVFGSYEFMAPQGFGGEYSEVMLLHPGEVVNRSQQINRSFLQSGYTYTVPLAASFNDAKVNETFTVEAYPVITGNQSGGGGGTAAGLCGAAALLLMVVVIASRI